MPEILQVEIVFATPERTWRRALEVARGTTVADAIRLSGFDPATCGGDFDPSRVGIFGQLVDGARILSAGDRIEIYRPLKIDPKEARRRRARR